VPCPNIPAPEIVAVIDSEAEPLAAFFWVKTITAAASDATALEANTVASVVAEIVSPTLRIDVVCAVDAFRSGAVTVTVHVSGADVTEPDVLVSVGINLTTYVPGTLGTWNDDVNFAVTYPVVFVAGEIAAVLVSADSATVALDVSVTANCGTLAVDGADNTADITETVSPIDVPKNDTDTTAVAVSPGLIVSATASMVTTSAYTVACVGSADITPNVKAAAKTVASFLNEFILLLISLY
jgi:hypothetical protein